MHHLRMVEVLDFYLVLVGKPGNQTATNHVWQNLNFRQTVADDGYRMAIHCHAETASAGDSFKYVNNSLTRDATIRRFGLARLVGNLRYV